MRRAVTDSQDASTPLDMQRAENLVQMRDAAALRQTKSTIRDWSNIAFAVSFCEKSRRDYEARLAS